MRPHYATDYIRKGSAFLFKLPMKHGKGRMGPRPPDSQSVLEPTGRFVPHNRVQGAEADRVNRAAPLLENTIIGLRSDTRSRARVAALLAAVSLRRET